MAEVLASLKKIGGNGEQYTETVLWTNPSPTASFTAQNVTLSDSLSNYKYIGIKLAYGTSYNTGEYLTTILLTVADFRKGGYDTSVRRNNMALGIISDANKSYGRTVYYIDDTSVRFATCYQVASSTTANNNAIPLEILGINELAHGVQDISTMRPDIVETFTGNNSSSTKTIAVTQKPRFVMYVQGRTTQNTAILMMFDIENETAWYYGLYNGGYRNSAETYSNYISSVSDTSVSITNFGSTTTMNQIYIYY